MPRPFIYKATALWILQSIAVMGTLHAASLNDDGRGLTKSRPIFAAPSSDLSAACQNATLSSRFNGCGEVRNRNTSITNGNSSLQNLQAIPQSNAFVSPLPSPMSTPLDPVTPVVAVTSSSTASNNVILDTLPQVDPNTFQTEITSVFNGVDNRNVNGRNTYGDPYSMGAQTYSTQTVSPQTPYSNIILDTLPQITSNAGPLPGSNPNTFQADITAVFNGPNDVNITDPMGPSYTYRLETNGQEVSIRCSTGDPQGGVVDGSAQYIGPFDYTNAREAYRSQCGATAIRPAPLDAPTATGPNYTYNMGTNGQAISLSCAAGDPRAGVVDGTVHYIGPFDYEAARNAFRSQCGAGAAAAPVARAVATLPPVPVSTPVPVAPPAPVSLPAPEPEPEPYNPRNDWF